MGDPGALQAGARGGEQSGVLRDAREGGRRAAEALRASAGAVGAALAAMGKGSSEALHLARWTWPWRWSRLGTCCRSSRRRRSGGAATWTRRTCGISRGGARGRGAAVWRSVRVGNGKAAEGGGTLGGDEPDDR